MPKVGDNAENLAARRVRNVVQIPYTDALRLVREHKTPDRNWGQAADAALAALAGPGLFPEDAQ